MQLEAHTTHKQLNIQGAKIATYEMGQGRPVLLLHGAPDSHDMWLPLAQHLTPSARVIMPDLPGFGQSTLPDGFDLSLKNMADFIRDLIAALDITEPVTMVTTDFGGHYGLAFTAQYPEMVRGIAISNTNFFSDYQWHSFARMYRTAVLGDLLMSMAGSSKSMMRRSLKSVAPKMPESYIDASFSGGFGSPAVRKTMLRMYRERDSKDFAGWEDKLVKVLQHKPAVVLWGDQDPFITPAFGDRFGKAQVHHFKEYSHWLPLEAPDQVAAVLLPWLQSL